MLNKTVHNINTLTKKDHFIKITTVNNISLLDIQQTLAYDKLTKVFHIMYLHPGVVFRTFAHFFTVFTAILKNKKFTILIIFITMISMKIRII